MVQVHTTGFHRTSDDVDARIAAGVPVEPGEYYFRLTSLFETDEPSLSWLTETQFVGVGEDLGDAIRIHFYAVV
ncbi:hypothetical protein RS83_00620 [Microbacterium oxydans]|uniref:DUF3237 domain-containing protein n=1 Tax=Microbacterium oxydans TaxID=82380 RepID=A0A0F0LG73_9MICO|nr:hypothetical protein RS83_00620 [Microbacterium oxydans]